MRALMTIVGGFVASCSGCLFIILGLTVLAGIYWVHTEQIEFAGISITTTGTVTDVRRGSGKTAALTRLFNLSHGANMCIRLRAL
jgi:hypothetical protein